MKARKLAVSIIICMIVMICMIGAAQADNLLTNGGFENPLNITNTSGTPVSGSSNGWNYQSMLGPDPASSDEALGNFSLTPEATATTSPIQIHGGSNAQRISGFWWANVMLWQDVKVKAGAEYTASIYVYAGNFYKASFAPTDSVGIEVTELDASGNVIAGTFQEAKCAAQSTGLELKQIVFTTSANTAKVRYTIHHRMAIDNRGWAVYDDASLDGPPADVDLLTNGGFENPLEVNNTSGSPISGTSNSWNYQSIYGSDAGSTDEALGNFCMTGEATAAAPILINSGENAQRIFGYWWSNVLLWQDVKVLPGSLYTASAYVYAGNYYKMSATDAVGIEISELDANGDVIAGTFREAKCAAQTTGFEYKQIVFTTTANTVKVRYAIHHRMAIDSRGWAVYDDASLVGPPPMGTISGVVLDADGNPIPSAKVQFGKNLDAGTTDPQIGFTTPTYNYSVNTAPDGSYSIDLPLGDYWVRASKDNFYAQQIARAATEAGEGADFSLTAVGNNILINAGMDDNHPGNGWSTRSLQAGAVSTQQWSGRLTPYIYYRSGEECAEMSACSDTGERWAEIYQTTPVVQGTQYTAKVWFRGAANPGTTMEWGTGKNTAMLYVQEYDSSNNPVGARRVVTANYALVSDWQPLSVTFTTNAATRKVEIGAHSDIYSKYAEWLNFGVGTYARMLYDDFELNGQKGTWGLSGVVRGAASPVSGADVQITDLTDTTQAVYTTTTTADGSYSLPGAQINHRYRVHVAAAGFYSMKQSATVDCDYKLDFDLQQQNMLAEAGFDDITWNSDGTFPSTSAWKYEESHTASGGTYIRRGDWAAQYSFAVFSQTGQQALEIGHGGAGNSAGSVYQDVAVQPATTYDASGWFRTYGPDWATDGLQYIGITATEYDSSGMQIGDPHETYLSVFDQWAKVNCQFTTSGATASLRVGTIFYLTNDYNYTQYRVTCDSFSLVGSQSVGAVKDLKALNDGALVNMTGAVVSAAFNGFFYIEDTNRVAGVKVVSDTPVSAGNLVTINGVLSNKPGEEMVINASSVDATTGGEAPDPLGMNNKSTDGSGLAATGLLVRVWGQLAVNGSSYSITDGSGNPIALDSITTLPSGVGNGNYVLVTGALGLDANGPVVHVVSMQKGN
ncbi:MAG: carboxypeptidase-like regulatory domain-containing protein [Armatimonadota bacterium]|nr:carboxypeptidase-like regulatory domain-containing protein [bacterium]